MTSTNTPPPTDEKPRSTSPATLALTLGIASIPLGWLLGYALGIPCSLVALVLSSMTLRRARHGQGTTAARTRAVGGLVAAFVGLTIPLVLNLLIGPEL